MTLPRTLKRQPQGIPAGGQFAHDIKNEAPGITLQAGHSPERVADATDELKKRRQQSWPAMVERLHREEGAWAASNAVLGARELFSNADSLEYSVDTDGTITELEILNDGDLVGSVWLDSAGRYRGSSDWIEKRVLTHLNYRSLDSLTGQGATVQDSPAGAGLKMVRVPFGEVLDKAHARHAGDTSTPPSAAAVSDALSARQVESWHGAMERHEQEETAWAASRAAINAREVFPDADLDELDYFVDSAGNVTGVEVLSKGVPVMSLHTNEDGTVSALGRNGKLHGPVLKPVSSAGLQQMQDQGATVREDTRDDEAAAGGGKIVNLRFDDVILNAAARLDS